MNGITREYYSMTDFAVSRAVEFVNELNASKEIVGKAAEMYPNLVQEDSVIFLYYFDLIKCYKKLGYLPDSSTRESLGLFLSVYHSMLGDKDITFELLDVMYSLGQEAFKNVVEAISPQLDRLPDDYGFLITNALDAAGGKADEKKRYNILLYRLCSIIAKADGTISQQESQWLAKLLKAGEDSKGNAEPKSKAEPSADRAQSHFTKKSTTVSEDQITCSSAIKELDALIGLEKVKKEVHTLANFALVQKRRGAKGLKSTPLSMHLIFSGNPGTGKTTVARIMGRIYRDLGLLEKGHLIETDRSDLVGEYVGHTAIKTNKVIDSALGGVLFIDEAYSLISDSKQDFGAEAIATLIKRMEDERDNLSVILAGYTDKMEEFLASNPGLNSRFSRKIEFEDYSAEDLFNIYKMQLGKYDYILTDAAAGKVLQVISEAVADKPADFGNGRYARNLFERTIESQANRVAYLADADGKTLCTIDLTDVESL